MNQPASRALILAFCVSSAAASARSVQSVFTRVPQAQVEPPWTRETFDPMLVHREPRTVTVETPIDVLWLIDNSFTMAEEQQKVISSFDRFAELYLSTNSRDIRMATITTDLFRAGQTGQANAACLSTQSQIIVEDYFFPVNYSRLLPGVNDGIRPRIGGQAPYGTVTDSGELRCGAQYASPRSGNPILDLQQYLATGRSLNQLVRDFKINAKVGVFGDGDERGMESIMRLIQDNENQSRCQGENRDPSCFFRKGSSRAIIVLSDECDHSMLLGQSTGNGQCVDGSGQASHSASAAEVTLFKNYMSDFFRNLDDSRDPRFFVSSIINEYGTSYRELVNQLKSDSTNSLGGKSMIGDIDAASYDSILDGLGRSITEVTTREELVLSFNLAKPASVDALRVTLVRANGTRVSLQADTDFVLEGTKIRITRSDWDSMIAENDILEVEYLPS